MEKIVVNGLVGLLLAVNSYLDWKKHEISLVSLLVFGMAGVGVNWGFGYQPLEEVLGGVLLGMLMVLATYFTEEAIGFGDGLLLAVTGLFLGFWETLHLLVRGLLLCALLMGIFMLLGRIDRNVRVPLVPFLLLSFIGGILV